MTTTFENARVGDRVYSPLFGKPDENGTNGEITDRLACEFCHQVKGDNGNHIYFSNLGQWYPNAEQCLFWRKPDFVVPEQPKRKRKVTLTKRLGAQPMTGADEGYIISSFFDATAKLPYNWIDLGEHEFTFFVEE